MARYLLKPLARALVAALLIFSWSLANADDIAPLLTDRESILARLQILNDPDLKEFNFSTYILRNDESGIAFMAQLAQAAKRGVKVRGIVDTSIRQAHSGYAIDALLRVLENAGVELRAYRPLSMALKPRLNLKKTFRLLNDRMHDKLCVGTFKDGHREAIVGDKNYSNENYKQIRYTGAKFVTLSGAEVLVRGESTTAQADYFDAIWESDNVVPLTAKKTAPDLVAKAEAAFASNGGRLDFYRAHEKFSPVWTPVAKTMFIHDTLDAEQKPLTTLHKILNLIDRAPKDARIDIENAYFVRFPRLLDVIRRAVTRGCHVRIVTNAQSAVPQVLVTDALMVDLKTLAETGAEIYLLPKGTHAKFTVIDDTVIIGSANFDPRSYSQNSESVVWFESGSVATQFRDRFNGKIKVSLKAASDGKIVKELIEKPDDGSAQVSPLSRGTLRERPTCGNALIDRSKTFVTRPVNPVMRLRISLLRPYL